MDNKTAIDILKHHNVLRQDFDESKPFQLNLSRDGHIQSVNDILAAMNDYAEHLRLLMHYSDEVQIYESAEFVMRKTFAGTFPAVEITRKSDGQKVILPTTKGVDGVVEIAFKALTSTIVKYE